MPVVTVIIPGRDEADFETSNARDGDLTPYDEEGINVANKTAYGKLIPVKALRQDVNGYYVLILREDNGVLGNGYRAERISVDLLETDKSYCEIQGFPNDEVVIIDATSEISVGDNVCYDGGELNDCE